MNAAPAGDAPLGSLAHSGLSMIRGPTLSPVSLLCCSRSRGVGGGQGQTNAAGEMQQGRACSGQAGRAGHGYCNPDACDASPAHLLVRAIAVRELHAAQRRVERIGAQGGGWQPCNFHTHATAGLTGCNAPLPAPTPATTALTLELFQQRQNTAFLGSSATLSASTTCSVAVGQGPHDCDDDVGADRALRAMRDSTHVAF